MTRKDYVAIGEALVKAHEAELSRTRQNNHFKPVVEHYDAIVTAVADVFEDNNERFDRDKFIKFVNGIDKKKRG